MPSPSPKRSFDVSTVVSILPYPLWEKKPGLNPGDFRIPAAPEGRFSLLTVERCTHPVYIDENRPRLIVPDPSDAVAQSICIDHKSAVIGFENEIAEPGLDWVSGEFEDLKVFAAQHADILREMDRKQTQWFRALLSIADDDWARYRQHKFITELQRTAATRLGQTNRDWLLTYRIEQSLSKCRFCYQQIHPLAIICPSCHGILDQEKYQKEYLGAGRVEKHEVKL